MLKGSEEGVPLTLYGLYSQKGEDPGPQETAKPAVDLADRKGGMHSLCGDWHWQG